MRAALISSSLLIGAATAGRFSDFSHEKQARAEDAIKRGYDGVKLEERQTSSYRFYNKKTKDYFVESLPDVNFDLRELYSGLVSIDYSNTSRALFFMFEPTVGAPVDEITIWLNGGPGCSSLEGFFQENGRYLWQPGTYSPTINEYSWVNLTNMLWVEQPVGTGFSIGTPTATTQEETAQDFIKFFKNFQDIFGIKNFKIYVTGESYAGRYVPYVSAAMLDANDKEYYDLSGALTYDPCIGSFVYAQEEIPAVPYVLQQNNILNLNDSFLQQIQEIDKSCGYAAFRDQYLQFPPSGVQPPLFFNYSANVSCDVFNLLNQALLDVQQCPLLWDVLSFPTELVYAYPGATTYFNRSDVKAAIHAPEYIDWAECASGVFVGGNSGPEQEGDNSADPIQFVLPQVIEATNRVLVGNGDFDMIILTNGTLMAIQNMTWNGMLGFQEMPSTPINITETDLQYPAVFDGNGLGGYDAAQGIMGVQHYERGLMWVETYQSGHMQPEFQPRAAYRHLSWLLGRTETI